MLLASFSEFLEFWERKKICVVEVVGETVVFSLRFFFLPTKFNRPMVLIGFAICRKLIGIKIQCYVVVCWGKSCVKNAQNTEIQECYRKIISFPFFVSDCNWWPNHLSKLTALSCKTAEEVFSDDEAS